LNRYVIDNLYTHKVIGKFEFLFGWLFQILDKKSYRIPKKIKTIFYAQKKGVKCFFQHILKNDLSLVNQLLSYAVSATLYPSVSFVFSREIIKTFKKTKNLYIIDLQKSDIEIFATKDVLMKQICVLDRKLNSPPIGTLRLIPTKYQELMKG
jgi:hypothetical protein